MFEYVEPAEKSNECDDLKTDVKGYLEGTLRLNMVYYIGFDLFGLGQFFLFLMIHGWV